MTDEGDCIFLKSDSLGLAWQSSGENSLHPSQGHKLDPWCGN